MNILSIGLIFVAGAVAHNAEEALLLPAWSAKVVRRYPRVRPKPFAFAVTVFTAVLFACAVAAAVGGAGSLGAYLFMGYVFAMAANAVIPHIALSVATRSYMPGTATGALLNLPIGVWLIAQASKQGFVESSTLVWVAPIVAACLAASIRPLLWLGGVLFGVPAASVPSGTERGG